MPRRDFFLSNFRRTDLLFRIFRLFPDAIRRRLLAAYISRSELKASENLCPDRMTLFLTCQCNLKCAHCFIAKEASAHSEMMTLEEYRRLFSSVCGEVSQALFTGGEPTLRCDFADIVVASSLEGQIPIASIFSNGFHAMLLAEQLEDILNRCNTCLHFQTSLDGPRAFHDHNRGIAGAFDRTVNAINRVQELARRYPSRFGRINVTTAISKQNLPFLEAICDIAMQTGASPAFAFVRTANDVYNLKNHSFKSAFAPEQHMADGSPRFVAQDFLTPEDMNRALDVLHRRIWQHDPGRLSFNFNRVTLEIIRDMQATHSSPLSRECGMGYKDIVILPDGRVSRCEMLIASADLRKHDFDLRHMIRSAQWRSYLDMTSGCYCTHDCGIGISMMKEMALLKRLI